MNVNRTTENISAAIADVVDFWTGAGERGQWFAKDEAFDRAFHDHFIDRHMAAAARRYEAPI